MYADLFATVRTFKLTLLMTLKTLKIKENELFFLFDFTSV